MITMERLTRRSIITLQRLVISLMQALLWSVRPTGPALGADIAAARPPTL
jgi:hypothetical protein